jgi:hypothetical protein
VVAALKVQAASASSFATLCCSGLRLDGQFDMIPMSQSFEFPIRRFVSGRGVLSAD